MVINVVNPFKSQVSKTFGKSKIRRDVQVGGPLPSVDIGFGLGKKFFRFGATTTLPDANAKSFEDTKSVQSSPLSSDSVDVRAGRQNITLKVKSAKNSITKLFKSTKPGSITGSVVNPLVSPGFEDCSTVDYSSTIVPSPVVQYLVSNAPVSTTSDSIPPIWPSLEATNSRVASGKDVADKSTKDLTSDFCDIVEAFSPSSTWRLFVTPVSPFDALSLASLFNVQRTTKGEDGVALAVVNTEETGLSSFASCNSWSSSSSKVTIYFSSNSLSAPSTTNGASLASSETYPSAITTSLATSVDAEEDYQSLPTTSRRLRRVPKYEDLRNPQNRSNRDFLRPSISSLSSYGDVMDGARINSRATPLHGTVQCDDVRKSFLPFENKICTSSTRRTNKFEKFQAWLTTRCHEASYNTRRLSAARVHGECQKVSSSRQFLQGVFRPSARIRGHVSKSAYQPLPPSFPPVWSCAKIARLSSKTKRRQRMRKQAMRELKARLNSVDIDPWY